MLLNEEEDRMSDYKAVRRHWYQALDKLKIPRSKIYSCRHTRASDMLMAGVDDGYAAKQMTHSRQMFLQVYADWIPTRAIANSWKSWLRFG